jgi:hypothetical protein
MTRAINTVGIASVTGAVNIADVDIASIAAGDTNIGNVDIASVTGIISTLNSTADTLDADVLFTGTGEDVSDYKSIGINVIASHASATDGMTFQFSSDGTNWDKVHSFTLAAATPKFFNIPVEAQWFRIVYTNGGTDQTYFRLQSIYHATMTKESTLRLSEDIDAETAAQLGRTVLAGKANGFYRNISLDNATGALPTMFYGHHELHEGNYFSYTSALDLTNAQTISYLLTTPNTTKWSHFGFELNGQAEFDVKIYEGATPDVVGSAVSNPAVINNNRNSDTVNTLTITSPTLGAGARGTLIMNIHAGSGKAGTGSAGSGEEKILKQNTKYWIDLKNETTSNNYISWVIGWYEHTNIT